MGGVGGCAITAILVLPSVELWSDNQRLGENIGRRTRQPRVGILASSTTDEAHPGGNKCAKGGRCKCALARSAPGHRCKNRQHTETTSLTKCAPIPFVQPTFQNDQVGTVFCIAIVDGSKDKHGQNSAECADNQLESAQEVEPI
jgi:hypothetical protein